MLGAVLLYDVDHLIGPSHVLAIHERHVVELIKLLVENRGVEGLVSPSGVLNWDGGILDTVEHGNWDVLDLGNVDLFWHLSSIFILVHSLTVVEPLEFLMLADLSIMSCLFPGSWLLIVERDNFDFWIVVFG